MPAVLGIVGDKRALEVAIQAWNEIVQGRLEIIQPVLDLVDHARANNPNLVALPQADDLLGDAGMNLAGLAGGRPGVVALDQVGDPAQLLQRSAAARLGWVGGKHE